VNNLCSQAQRAYLGAAALRAPCARLAKVCRLLAEINELLIAIAQIASHQDWEGLSMKWSFAMALGLLGIAAAPCPVLAQGVPAACNAFIGLKNEAEQKALAVRSAMEHKADRKDICALVQRFYTAEEAVVKFLEKNKVGCGVPEQAITVSKTNHEHTLKFQTAACAEPKPRAPSLSDAIGTPSVDTAGNTKTGRGTLDTLNGNPLAK
jgi:hypothetical protein